MDQKTSINTYEGVVVPEPVLLKPVRSNRYGSIKDLPDEELAEPDELERVVYKEMWWPVLRLPQQRWECPIRPNIDEDGRIEWGAFGSADFESYRPQFNKLRYKIEKLREKLKDIVFTLKMMSARIPGISKYKILRMVKKELLDIGDIADNQMYFLAEMYLQAWLLREEIERLQRKRRQQREEELTTQLV